MRQHLIIILMLLFSFNSKGQSSSSNEIREMGNKYLRTFIQDTAIFSYCIPDKEIGIKYKCRKSDTLFDWVKNPNAINLCNAKMEIISYTLCWYLKFPYPECPVYDTIKGRFYIVLDKSLSLIKKPELSFIPISLYLHESCKFISKEKALEITKSQNFKFGIDSLNMNLIYDDKRKLYIWDITKIKCKTIDEMGRCWGDIEILILDAETGSVINHHITSFGWIVD